MLNKKVFSACCALLFVGAIIAIALLSSQFEIKNAYAGGGGFSRIQSVVISVSDHAEDENRFTAVGFVELDTHKELRFACELYDNPADNWEVMSLVFEEAPRGIFLDRFIETLSIRLINLVIWQKTLKKGVFEF